MIYIETRYRGYKPFQEELIQTIDILIEKAFKRQSRGRDISATILEINADKYRVNIDGHDYWLKDGIGLGLKVGMPVWIRFVNGANMYIASRK